MRGAEQGEKGRSRRRDEKEPIRPTLKTQFTEHEVQSFLDSLVAGGTLRRTLYEGFREFYGYPGLAEALMRRFGNGTRAQWDAFLWYWMTRPGQGIRDQERPDRKRCYARMHPKTQGVGWYVTLADEVALDKTLPEGDIWISHSKDGGGFLKLILPKKEE